MQGGPSWLRSTRITRNSPEPPVLRNRPPHRRLPRSEPRRAPHQDGHRRRDPPARARPSSQPCTPPSTTMADARDLPRLRPRAGLRTSCARPSPKHDFRARGIDIDTDEIFIVATAPRATAATSATSSSRRQRAWPSCDPVYPVYVDSNAMAGRAGELRRGRRVAGRNIVVHAHHRRKRLLHRHCPTEPGRHHLPLLRPNNPTGTVLTARVS